MTDRVGRSNWFYFRRVYLYLSPLWIVYFLANASEMDVTDLIFILILSLILAGLFILPGRLIEKLRNKIRNER